MSEQDARFNGFMGREGRQVMAGSSELELVTGYRGKTSVTADACRQRGRSARAPAGAAEGDELAAEMVDSNTLRIQYGTRSPRAASAACAPAST